MNSRPRRRPCLGLGSSLYFLATVQCHVSPKCLQSSSENQDSHIWYTRKGRSLYDFARLPTNVVISSSCVGARRNRDSFLSWNLKTWKYLSWAHFLRSSKTLLTSEPSFNRPDCSQSSWEDNDDSETLDAPFPPSTGHLIRAKKVPTHRLISYAYQ